MSDLRIEAFWGLISIAIAIGFWNLFRDFMLDRFRQRIFHIRDELFLLTSDQNTGIKHSTMSVSNFRTLLNGTIRYAHRSSLVFGILFARQVKDQWPEGKVAPKVEYDLKKELKQLADRETADKISALFKEYEMELFVYLILTSPTAILITLLLFAGAILSALIDVIKKGFKALFPSDAETDRPLPVSEVVFTSTKRSIRKSFGPQVKGIEIEAEHFGVLAATA